MNLFDSRFEYAWSPLDDDNKDSIIINPLDYIKKTAGKNRSRFNKAEIDDILNKSLYGTESEVIDVPENIRWTTAKVGLRMRN